MRSVRASESLERSKSGISETKSNKKAVQFVQRNSVCTFSTILVQSLHSDAH